ncbi:MAG: HEAT repeat domain-containing protein [Gemmataceae bacterium]|nr:HEAT repeat domain-containing protein [Gemmataceae bacterium]
MRRVHFTALVLGLVLIASSQQSRAQQKEAPSLDDCLTYLKSDKSTDRAFALSTMGLMKKDALSAAKLIVGSYFDSSPDVRQAADLALKNVNPDLYKPVTSLVQTQNYDARVQAITDLAKMGKDGAAALPAMVNFFKDGAKGTERAAVVKAMGEVGLEDKAFTPEMAQLALKDPDPAVRQAALKALPKMADAAGQMPTILSAVANDKTPANRIEAINVLGVVGGGNKDAIKSLQGVVADQNQPAAVREAAKKALMKVQK